MKRSTPGGQTAHDDGRPYLATVSQTGYHPPEGWCRAPATRRVSHPESLGSVHQSDPIRVNPTESDSIRLIPSQSNPVKPGQTKFGMWSAGWDGGAPCHLCAAPAQSDSIRLLLSQSTDYADWTNGLQPDPNPGTRNPIRPNPTTFDSLRPLGMRNAE